MVSTYLPHFRTNNFGKGQGTASELVVGAGGHWVWVDEAPKVYKTKGKGKGKGGKAKGKGKRSLGPDEFPRVNWFVASSISFFHSTIEMG